jgi:hypothetical protein
MQQVCALPIAGLQACTLEPFRIAGRERFAVRWLAVSSQPTAAAQTSTLFAGASTSAEQVSQVLGATVQRPPTPEFVVPPARMDLWHALLSICERIDSAVMVHGDRFSRSIGWNGKLLGEVRTVGGALVASAATGVVRDLRDMRDVHRFGDQLLRAYVRHAEIDLGDHAAAEEPSYLGHAGTSMVSDEGRFSATRHAVGDRRSSSDVESLRSSLAAAKLSPEEYSALGEPASVAGPIIEGSVARDRS